jgi:hypothetical protein
MLMRVGLLLLVTGLTFIVIGWLGAIGPALMIIGSGCAAIAFEQVLAGEQARPLADESAIATADAVIASPETASAASEIAPSGTTPRAA